MLLSYFLKLDFVDFKSYYARGEDLGVRITCKIYDKLSKEVRNESDCSHSKPNFPFLCVY